MEKSDLLTFFGEAQAKSYDERWNKLAPVANSLHFLIRIVLGNLPAKARILCVGAGTGAEVLFLAEHFPQWTFTLVEPSGPMLKVAREKMKAAGISDRCDFHEDFLHTHVSADLYDAATTLFVSQFLTVKTEREDFFKEIAKRLRPGGILINSELTTPALCEEFDRMFDVWLRAQNLAPAEGVLLREAWNTQLAVSSDEQIQSVVQAGGFDRPVRFFQALFMCAWFSKKI
ncbi:hypothetical protein AZI86_08605 [Bdellovibrio bacteriovorus]|uniref:Methyltransferase type 12 domain-containing protein n=1 Tax=Bdellovibrio bacteriovorus TaxID=959 RepID=A0A150WRD0_BDEBC|nr:class I SAM-dependent methyltransferase [Bdellovibrio bacteriovorus]KYG67063.1 hypothetical protein AZI86_08605 [Bdellovibrio bacteriovorus]